jgi:hypothetical protein
MSNYQKSLDYYLALFKATGDDRARFMVQELRNKIAQAA